jgi:ABC-type polysaccharide/polyol phosphate export permease
MATSMITPSTTMSRAKVQRYWDVLRVFVHRNLSARYRGSVLGIFWSLLNPLTMTGLYTAIFGGIFGNIFSEYYHNSSIHPFLGYALAAFTGLIVINFFAASTTQSLTSVVANGPMLNKIKLPISVFPVAANMANVFQLLVGPLPILAIMTLITSKSLLNVLLLIFPILSLVMVCLGIGFFASALYVFFRDLPYFFELVVFVLWISSPVFYPAKIVPPQVKPFLALNPLSNIIESIRQIALSGTLPDIGVLASSLMGGIIILVLGWSCFQWWRPQFMDLL